MLGPQREGDGKSCFWKIPRERKYHSSSLRGAEHSLVLLEGTETQSTSVCLRRVNPVASDLHLSLAAWDFQHSVWGLVIAFFPNASLQISKQHHAGSVAGSETRARMSHPSSLRRPMTHLHGEMAQRWR